MSSMFDAFVDELQKTSELVGHITGIGASGKTTLLNKLKKKHPNLVTQDLDHFLDEIRANDPKMDKFTLGPILTKKVKAFLKENKNKPTLIGGTASRQADDIGIPAEKRWMLDTGPATAAWRKYRRPNERPWVGPVGERLDSVFSLPGKYLKNRRDIKKLKSRGYTPMSEDAIVSAIQERMKTAAADELSKLALAPSMTMPFPGTYNRALLAGTKTSTVRTGAERGRYKPGMTYEATSYKGQPLGVKVRVQTVETTPLSGVDAKTRVGTAQSIQGKHGTSLAEQVEVVRFQVVK